MLRDSADLVLRKRKLKLPTIDRRSEQRRVRRRRTEMSTKRCFRDFLPRQVVKSRHRQTSNCVGQFVDRFCRRRFCCRRFSRPDPRIRNLFENFQFRNRHLLRSHFCRAGVSTKIQSFCFKPFSYYDFF